MYWLSAEIRKFPKLVFFFFFNMLILGSEIPSV